MVTDMMYPNGNLFVEILLKVNPSKQGLNSNQKRGHSGSRYV